MTTEDSETSVKLARLTENLTKVELLTARLMKALAERRAHDAALDGPGQDVYMKAAASYVAEMMQNPGQGAGASDRLLGQDAEALC